MTTIRKLFFLFITALLACLTVSAQQEMLFPLHSNKTIKNYLYQQQKATYSAGKRIAIISDTLPLPFVDDFSYDGVYPDQNLWVDSNVFINRDFPVDPPTIGVATFDGLDKFGNPYNPFGTVDSICDYLTSKFIQIDTANTYIDTTVWLSFFYQPQGLGYAPDDIDSLRLEFQRSTDFVTGTVTTIDTSPVVTWIGGNLFVTNGQWTGASIAINGAYYTIDTVLDDTHLIINLNPPKLANANYSINIWNEVWSIPGGSLAPFEEALVHLDSSYVQTAFRFRFSNIANVNGNVDHWHLDYVRLNRGRSAVDTGFTNEGAFLYRNKSLIAPPYTSMPYSHYKINPSLFTASGDTEQYKNLSDTTLNLTHEFQITIADTIYKRDATPVSLLNGVPKYSTVQYTDPFSNYSLPVTSQPFLEFTTWNIQTIKDVYPQNDTVREPQILNNYYSYDDGTAELAYGIYGAAPGAELAYQFDAKMTDTLRGVQIYWNPIGPDIHNHLINIAVWHQITPNTNNDSIIYQLFDQEPVNVDSLNGFYTYIFDQVVVIDSGTFYIGWVQEDVDILNVGFDQNTDNHDKLYYNTLGVWQQSSIEGTVMMRPVFGSTLNTGVHEIHTGFNATVFPNPADKQITIQCSQSIVGATTLELYNALGELVLIRKQDIANSKSETVISVSNLQDGFYLLKITDNKSSQFVTNKILISH